MDCNSVKIGIRVKTTVLDSTHGRLVSYQYIACRQAGQLGTVLAHVPGHGGDVWFVRHEGSEDIGVYCYNEIEPV